MDVGVLEELLDALVTREVSGNGVRRQRPSPCAQLLGERRMAAESADAGVEGFRRGLPEVPVGNERQSVGSAATLTVELTGDQPVAALKDPTEKADRSALSGVSFHGH